MLVQNSLVPGDYQEELAISLGLLLRLASEAHTLMYTTFSTGYSACIRMELPEISC